MLTDKLVPSGSSSKLIPQQRGQKLAKNRISKWLATTWMILTRRIWTFRSCLSRTWACARGSDPPGGEARRRKRRSWSFQTVKTWKSKIQPLNTFSSRNAAFHHLTNKITMKGGSSSNKSSSKLMPGGMSTEKANSVISPFGPQRLELLNSL